MTDWRPMPAQLRTDRLVLGPWHERDLDDLVTLVAERDPRTAAAPRDGHPTREELGAVIRRRRAELEATGIALLAVRVDGAFAGYCGLTVGRATLDEPEIAYELLRRFHRRGYATEAARAVVRAAADTGRTRLWATVRTWNDPSFRVLDKLGFERTRRTTTDDFGELVWCTLRLEPGHPEPRAG